MKPSRMLLGCLLAFAMGGCGEEPAETADAATTAPICPDESATASGALLPADACMSLTIDGPGYFVFHGACQEIDGAAYYPQYFGKTANLRLSTDGFLTHDDGLRLQGYSTDAYGNLQYPLQDVQIAHSYIVPSTDTKAVNLVGPLAPQTPDRRIYAHPSTQVGFGTGGNLPPQSPSDYIPDGLDITTLAEQLGETAPLSFHYSQNVTVFDNAISETGPRAHPVTLYFTQKATHSWQWHAVIAADTLEPTSLTTANSDIQADGILDADARFAILAGGHLFFSDDGTLTNTTPEERALLAQDTDLNNFAFLNTLDPQTIQFNFAASHIQEGSGAFGLTPTADGSLGFEPGNPEMSSHTWTSVTIADANALAHTINIFFNESADRTWQWHAITDGTHIVDPTTDDGTRTGENVVLADGLLTFDSNGRLLTESQTDRTFHFVGTDGTQRLVFDFGDNITAVTEGGDGGDGSTGIRLTGTASSITAHAMHEETSRILKSIAIDTNGLITGSFTYTSQTRVIAGLALASFTAEESLTPQEDNENLFTSSAESGEAMPGQAGSDGRGTLSTEVLGPACIDS